MIPTQADAAPIDADEAAEAAGAMNDQLRQDIASWREGRAHSTARETEGLSVAAASPIVPPTTARIRKAKPVPLPVAPPTNEKKPFQMSYGGTSRAEYLKDTIARGAR